MPKIDHGVKLSFDDVLLVPSYSSIESRRDVDTSWQLGKYNFRIPIISANMDTITGEKMARKMGDLGGLGVIHRYQTLREGYWEIVPAWKQNRTDPIALSVGSLANDKERIDWCIKESDIICIDISHGHSKHMIDTLHYIRDAGFEGPLIAGNVVTRQAVVQLEEAGADLIKVGVGPGSVCTTRLVTGCGYPQLSAILECSGNLHQIIADGGICQPGDAAKALAAGATTVMIGGMLAGTDCVPDWDQAARIQNFSSGVYSSLNYRGMASQEARRDFTGNSSRYVEGVSKQVKIQPEGSTESVVNSIVSGIESAMSFAGAETLDEFTKLANFVRVTESTKTENTPHFN